MKRLITLILLLVSITAYTQTVPQGFNLQAVARDAGGNIISDQVIGVRVSLVSTTNTSNILYRETQFP